MAETDALIATRLRNISGHPTIPAWAKEIAIEAATALTDRDAQIERLTREKEEALNELHMKWCMACGTLTNDGDCDCTMYNGDASLQELRPYIEEYQKSMIECLSKAEARATTAERERDEALEQLRMQWCSACGVISAHGGCDCTKVPDTAGLRRAVDFAKEFGKMVQEATRERDEARAEVERKDAALREARKAALLEAAEVFDVYASDQRACIAKGWVRGRGIKDAEVRAETWEDAAKELRLAAAATAIRALIEHKSKEG